MKIDIVAEVSVFERLLFNEILRRNKNKVAIDFNELTENWNDAYNQSFKVLDNNVIENKGRTIAHIIYNITW